MAEPTALDLITLSLAIVGAITGVAALVWQAAEFALTGARLKVTIKSALVGRGGAVVGEGPSVWNQAARLADDGYTTPAYAVAVTNRGRFPASIESVAIGLDKLSLRPIGDLMGPSLPHRLEGGSGETWYIEAEQVWAAEESGVKALGARRRGARAVVGLADGREARSKSITVLRFSHTD